MTILIPSPARIAHQADCARRGPPPRRCRESVLAARRGMPQSGLGGEFLSASPPRETFDAVAELAARLGVTPFTVFAAAVLVLLNQLTGETDIVVGVPSDNRVMPGSERLIGCFLNVLPVRVDCSGSPAFADLVLRLRDAPVAAYDHQSLHFHAEKVRGERGPEHD